MTQCEMCGKQINNPIHAKIEGADMLVCSNCAELGVTINVPKRSFKAEKTKFQKQNTERYEERIIAHPGQTIKNAREKKGMRQQDLAKMIQMKDSYLHHIETGDITIPIDIAKKLEEALEIKLIKKFKQEKKQEFESTNSALTIADLLNKEKSQK